MAIFRDSTAGALAAGLVSTTSGDVGHVGSTGVIHHWVAAASTDATTFKLRCGDDSGDRSSINGQITARRFGGVSATTLTITEFSA